MSLSYIRDLILLVNNFTLIPGFMSGPNGDVYYQWSLNSIQKFDDGQYRYATSEGTAFGFKISAEGYASSESRIIYPEEEQAEIDFYLEKGIDTHGVVYDAEGNPVEGADVYIPPKDRYLRFENLRIKNNQIQPVKTDKDGRFSLSSEDEKFLIIAIHPGKGFAEVYSEDFQNPQAVYLTRWGKVEGEVYIGSKPAANAEILVYFRKNHESEYANYSFDYNIKTDAAGSFSVDNIIADQAANGSSWIARLVMLNDLSNNYNYVDRENIEVLPGETTYVVLGGQGRKVVGNMVKPSAYTEPVSWTASYGYIRTANADYPTEIYQQAYNQVQYPLPAGYDSMTVAEVLNWFNQWRQSDDAKEFYNQIQLRLQELSGQTEERVHNNYRAIVHDDGSFEADNVQEGDYSIDVTLYELRGIYEGYDYTRPIGKSDFKFTMPEITDENIDEPLDVGSVVLESVQKLALGEPLPQLQFKDYNGNTIDINSYRGKLLLISFWHIEWVTNESHNSDMDAIKLLQDTLAANDKIEMLGITTSNVSRPFYDDLRVRYLKEKGITFNQAIVEVSEILSRIINQSGRRYPINILIDANGDLISAGLKDQQLDDAIAKALEDLKN